MVHSLERKKSTLDDKGGQHVDWEVRESTDAPKTSQNWNAIVCRRECSIVI
ncbi:hypothetical protein HU200_036296 [Digitaria exilis]|uniref:Uncharacterized protein n=1 Tax=Digitaria exilis TaxID=1010633 RepID=A0A835ENH2_9POAL|nr:hypothetical protein HU200_036296 [Digitaria exilis]